MTLGYSHSSLRLDRSALDLIQQLKVSHLEIRIDDIEPSSLLYQGSYRQELSTICQDLGLTRSVHSYAGVNLAEKVPRIRRFCTELFLEQMDFCHRIGARWLTVHAGTCGFGSGDPRKASRLQFATEEMSRMLERTVGSRVCIGIENVRRLPPAAGKTYLGDCFDELQQFFRCLPERAGFVFDSGHANLNPERDAQSLLTGLWDRLLGFHLHSNQGDIDSHESLTDAWIADREALFQLIVSAGAHGCPLIVEHHSVPLARNSLEVVAARLI